MNSGGTRILSILTMISEYLRSLHGTIYLVSDKRTLAIGDGVTSAFARGSICLVSLVTTCAPAPEGYNGAADTPTEVIPQRRQAVLKKRFVWSDWPIWKIWKV